MPPTEAILATGSANAADLRIVTGEFPPLTNNSSADKGLLYDVVTEMAKLMNIGDTLAYNASGASSVRYLAPLPGRSLMLAQVIRRFPRVTHAMVMIDPTREHSLLPCCPLTSEECGGRTS